MRRIDKLVIHCSDSPDHTDVGVTEIRQWHRERGWANIGYHFVIRRDGDVEVGRPLVQIGAHVQGHNRNTIGICWVGRDVLSPEQTKSLLGLCIDLMQQFGLTPAHVVGHRELAPLSGKTCPNLNMGNVRAALIHLLADPKPAETAETAEKE